MPLLAQMLLGPMKQLVPCFIRALEKVQQHFRASPRSAHRHKAG